MTEPSNRQSHPPGWYRASERHRRPRRLPHNADAKVVTMTEDPRFTLVDLAIGLTWMSILAAIIL